jgi:hypothetical protein
MCPPWFATRSADVVHAARHFNLSNCSVGDFVAWGGWQGYDVVRFYTNIHTQDLIDKLCTVMGRAWQRHTIATPSCICVQVF